MTSLFHKVPNAQVSDTTGDAMKNKSSFHKTAGIPLEQIDNQITHYGKIW